MIASGNAVVITFLFTNFKDVNMATFLSHFKLARLIRSTRICRKYLSSSIDVTLMRHVNPVREHRDTLVENLCEKLHLEMPDKYSFLSKKPRDDQDVRNLLSHMSSQPDDKSLSLSIFESWMSQANSLSLVYYLHANRDKFHSEEFLTRIVKHLSSNLGKLNAEEIVALWISLYFTQRIWTTEELYEHLDMNDFQLKLSEMVRTRSVSNAELCCIFMAMKRVSGLSLYMPYLRDTLYLFILSCDINQESDLLISLMLPIMQQDNCVKKDQEKHLSNLLDAFFEASGNVSTQTLLHVIIHCMRVGDHMYHDKLTCLVVDRIIHNNDVKRLSVNELKKLSKLLTRMRFIEFDKSISTCLLQELSMIADHECKLTDTRDILQSWAYLLISFECVDSEKLKMVFQAINEMHTDALKMSGKELAREVIKSVHKKLFPMSAANNDLMDAEFKQQIQVKWENVLVSVLSLDKVFL